MKSTISYLNTEIFGETVNLVGDDPSGGGNEVEDELSKLLAGFAGIAVDENEEPLAAPFSRASSLDTRSNTPSPVPPPTAKVAARSSTRRVAETADVPLATPPLPKRGRGEANKSKRGHDSEGTVPGAAPSEATKKTRSKAGS